MKTRMLKTIQETKMHDHTCLFFNNNLEFFHCAIPFITEGLKNNEKCFVVVDEITREEVLKNFKYLFRDGRNPFEELGKNSRVEIIHFKDVYLIDGFFNTERTIENYLAVTEQAIANGFSGVRVFAEVSDSLKSLANQEEFLLYEEKIDKYFNDHNFLAVCAYSKKHFSDNFLSKMLRAHPIEIDLLRTRL